MRARFAADDAQSPAELRAVLRLAIGRRNLAAMRAALESANLRLLLLEDPTVATDIEQAQEWLAAGGRWPKRAGSR